MILRPERKHRFQGLLEQLNLMLNTERGGEMGVREGTRDLGVVG